ncbi:MAG: hypothetical protein D6725_07250 [Planctomycetota bacterium]|nr:MAG: hypothetical protein D6725_07250 [Planctomycetota bacterium]
MNETAADVAQWRIEVRSGARLHFGLLAAGGRSQIEYGGVGVIVDRPHMCVCAGPAGAEAATGGERSWTICGGERWAVARTLEVLRRLEGGRARGDSSDEDPFGVLRALAADEAVETCESPRCSGPVPMCGRMELRSVPPPHTGFGSGTQFCLSVGLAAVLCRLRQWGWRVRRGVIGGEPADGAGRRPDGWSARERAAVTMACRLADRLGRSRRSAVGTIGFAVGGLVAEGAVLDPSAVPVRDGGSRVRFWAPGDGSRAAGGPKAPVRPFARVTVPDGWRFLVVWRRAVRGVAGHRERRVFRELCPMNNGVVRSLRRLANEELLRAAASADFDAFAQALVEYGSLVGRFFSAYQGGTLADARLSRVLRQLPARFRLGWAQSSWGPAVFAPCRTQAMAEQLERELHHRLPADAYRTVVAAPRNAGASVALRDTGRGDGASLFCVSRVS